MKIKHVSSLALIKEYLKKTYGDKLIAINYTDYDSSDFDVLADVSSLELASWVLEEQAQLWKNGKQVVELENWCQFVRDILNYFGGEVKAELLKNEEYNGAYYATD